MRKDGHRTRQWQYQPKKDSFKLRASARSSDHLLPPRGAATAAANDAESRAEGTCLGLPCHSTMICRVAQHCYVLHPIRPDCAGHSSGRRMFPTMICRPGIEVRSLEVFCTEFRNVLEILTLGRNIPSSSAIEMYEDSSICVLSGSHPVTHIPLKHRIWYAAQAQQFQHCSTSHVQLPRHH